MTKFRVAVAGCGGMANIWVENAISRKDTEIVALVDIRKESAESMAQRHGLSCGVYTDIQEAIQESDANLVFDVTIPDSHYAVTTAAFRLGCDVMGEKPMANTMDEAVRMVSASEQTGKKYAIMQNRRYQKEIRALKDFISSETIGQPGFICADFFLGPHFGGFRDLMDSPLILDMAIHTFDQARFIMGADPVSVYCHEFNPPGSWYKGNASAICIFEFADGSVFCYRGSWCAEGVPTSWEAEWRITGSKGTAIWDGTEANPPYCEVLHTEDANPQNYKKIEANLNWDGRNGHLGCFDEMFAALIEGRDAETECHDNVKSVAMVFGALESAAQGRKVSL